MIYLALLHNQMKILHAPSLVSLGPFVPPIPLSWSSETELWGLDYGIVQASESGIRNISSVKIGSSVYVRTYGVKW